VTRRYFVTDLPAQGGVVALPEQEAHHAAKVMRAQVGDRITLFDGAGQEAAAVIESIGRRDCAVRCQGPVHVNREPTRKIHLAVALPKGDRAKEMVERLTELGVAKLTPLICERTQRPPSSSQMSKLRRVVIEACKQSQRNCLMMIDEPVEFTSFIQSETDETRWFIHPAERLVSTIAGELSIDQSVVAMIGPEGGFSDAETEIAKKSGSSFVGLGMRIYRIETAAVVVAAKLT
jgi:16S rRNA (uracil1498-N3)-methyltransferase